LDPAFDLVLGGPPCVDYSGVNASRQGSNGESGSLMVKFGKLIKRMQDHPSQGGTTLFFLAENVKLQGEDLQAVSDAFGVEGMELESSCFSPCFRLRMYWFNFARDTYDFTQKAAFSAMSCLDDKYQTPAYITGQREGTKACTFMASKSRLDDDRMLVFRQDPCGSGKFTKRSINTEERGRMMGFPDKYVSLPLRPLFAALQTGLSELFWFQHPGVPKKYHCFSGELLRVDAVGSEQGTGALSVGVAPPAFKSKEKMGEVQFFDELSYGKRLYGNAWNVPTIEFLLKPLQELFVQHDHNDRYNCKYVFENQCTEDSGDN